MRHESIKIRVFLVIGLLALLSSAGICGTYSGGDGEVATPYQISTAADWAELVATAADFGKSFIVTANIDFGDGTTEIESVGISTAAPFSGTFDGNGFTFSDFTNATPSLRDQVGLFGVNMGTIKNLNVKNCTITGGDDGAQTTSQYTAALVSENAYGGVVDNCTVVNATITTTQAQDQPAYCGVIAGANHGTVKNCYVIGGTIKADITSTNTLTLGGIVGFQTGGSTAGQVGRLENCHSTITISDLAGASDEPEFIDVGGIAGRLITITGHYNYISGCSHIGAISYTSQTKAEVGGIAGQIYSNIYDSFHIGPITVDAATTIYVGGGIGYFNDAAVSALVDGCWIISDISVDDTASATSYVGGFVGSISAGAGTTKISNCFAKGSLYDANLGSRTLGFTNAGGFGGWQTRTTISNCYCVMATMTDGAAGITKGFIGAQSLTPTVTDSFWNSTTSGITDDDGFTGTTAKTTTELQSQNTFSSWRLGEKWQMLSSEYPVPVGRYSRTPLLYLKTGILGTQIHDTLGNSY